jgi:phosphoribosylaminoimidazolecarboxamide formyltransferase/IMP cyclohydrolase
VNGDIAGTIMKEADFVECVIAPSYTADALKILKVRKNLRLLEVKGFATRSKKTIWDMKKVMGGLLVQDEDIVGIEEADLKCVTKRRPTKAEIESLVFAALVVKHVRSNAIVLCQGMKTVGIGAGQMSRVDSVVIAVRKAANRAKGSALASDAFFPKEDGIEEAARAGVTSIIQPGGSIRDPEVIKKANEFGIAMVFTGIRHFKH